MTAGRVELTKKIDLFTKWTYTAISTLSTAKDITKNKMFEFEFMQNAFIAVI